MPRIPFCVSSRSATARPSERPAFAYGTIPTSLPSALAMVSSPLSRLESARIADGCVWTTAVRSTNACISVSIDGSESPGRSRCMRNSSAIISSVSESTVRNFLRYRWSRHTNPDGSMVPMAAPDALTNNALRSSPVRVRMVVLSDVLPPPCMARSGSLPTSRVA